MASRAELRRLLLQSRREADGHMQAIRDGAPVTFALLERELTAYVLAKFLLTADELPEDGDFDEVARRSLAKSMHIAPALVEEFDTARSCDGATSVMAKKVLLFMAIQRALDIELPALESARLRTMGDLSAMVWKTLAQDPAWQGKIHAAPQGL